MIGVLSQPGQAAIVEEFFELFKTPWEIYRPGRNYDIVIATADPVRPIDARLLLVYGSESKNSDAQQNIVGHACHQNASVRYGDTLLPIYGTLLTFEDRRRALPGLTYGSEAAALLIDSPASRVIRIGYDLFHEVQLLLSAGQPAAHAHVPTLDLHIRMLRDWILDAGIPLVEIPPVPAGHSFAVCLTHDIDFIGIRDHRLDHSMWGFLYRSTVGGLRDLARRRISIPRLLKMWRAAAALPFVYLGWARDFWHPFEWYLRVEENLPATYYLIPFKRRQGDKVARTDQSRRATAYDVGDLPQWTAALTRAGCEIGVHGIDAWHSVEKGREELARIRTSTGDSGGGIRMHWLLNDAGTPQVLEQAGYTYDSTAGYNETIGYRSGTTQVFRPLGVQTLLELPLHIQDGALFFRDRLDLPEAEAWKRCEQLIGNAGSFGGVLTLLWHDRSHGPERFWGEFYIRLVQWLRSSTGWFGTAAQVVGWFRKRREVRFERLDDGDSRTVLSYCGDQIRPPLTIRVHRPTADTNGHETRRFATSTSIDMPWDGTSELSLDSIEEVLARTAVLPSAELYSLS